MPTENRFFGDILTKKSDFFVLGSDVSYITGLGSIRLRNYDGSIRALTYVWYVPKLKKNLIFLWALESKGRVVIIQDGVLNIISNALLVMKGTRRNNLYYYNGSIVIRVVAMISSEDLDNTSLWHRCLGPTTGVVNRYRHDPGKGHWHTEKWVLWYLWKTVDVSLVFEQDDTCDQYAIGFVDSNCAGDLDKR